MLGRKAPPKPVELEAGQERTTFAGRGRHRRGRGRAQRRRRLPEEPRRLPQDGRQDAPRRAALRPARHRQDPARAGGGGHFKPIPFSM